MEIAVVVYYAVGLINMLNKILKYIKLLLQYHFGRMSYNTLFLNLTSRCNSNCVFCEAKYLDKSKDLTTDRIKELLAEAKELGIKKVYFSGGEPSVHPDFWEIVDYTVKLGHNLIIVSNGLLVERFKQKQLNLLKKASAIDISLESYQAKIHNQLRGGSDFFERTVRGIKILKARDIKVNLNTVISNKNYLELSEIVKFAKKLGVNFVNFQPMHIWTNYQGINNITKEQFSITINNLNSLKKSMAKAIKLSKQIGQRTNLPAVKPWIIQYFVAQSKKFQKDVWMKDVLSDFKCSEVFTKLFIHSDGSLQPCAMLGAVDNIKDKELIDAIRNMKNFKDKMRYGIFSAECHKCSCQMVPNYIFSIFCSPIRNTCKLFVIIKDLF